MAAANVPVHADLSTVTPTTPVNGNGMGWGLPAVLAGRCRRPCTGTGLAQSGTAAGDQIPGNCGRDVRNVSSSRVSTMPSQSSP